MYNDASVRQIQFQQKFIKYYYQPNKLIKSYQKDIIHGVYQGGFQVWQCELDLLNYLSQLECNKFQNCKVIQIGCGHGLLAIGSYMLGATDIVFQDYNQNVLDLITKPTVQLNSIKTEFEYLAGDWQDIIPNNNVKFDIILGSQLIYNEINYCKIVKVIKKYMKNTGKCILANKHYYFGVGGNMPAFKQYLEKQKLKCTTLRKICPQIGGNKKQIVQIQFYQ